MSDAELVDELIRTSAIAEQARDAVDDAEQVGLDANFDRAKAAVLSRLRSGHAPLVAACKFVRDHLCFQSPCPRCYKAVVNALDTLAQPPTGERT